MLQYTSCRRQGCKQFKTLTVHRQQYFSNCLDFHVHVFMREEIVDIDRANERERDRQRKTEKKR